MSTTWPHSTDYIEAVQAPAVNFADPDLRSAEVVTNAMGLPQPCSGNFADVYQFRTSDGRRSWAVKCFTRPVSKLSERYREISQHLEQARLPFSVEFKYLEQGVRIRGQWYPVVKMDWVEGLTLSQWARQNLGKPKLIEILFGIWLKIEPRLRQAQAAHGDLQHGNVLLVPGTTENSLALKLIDYDGMWVPSLGGQSSGEVGHPSYQHPQRARQSLYTSDVDRFPHLVIAFALRCLARPDGAKLWTTYDSGENLLFTREDFVTPAKSKLFRELWDSGDHDLQAWTGRLAIAAQSPLEATPLLAKLLDDQRRMPPLSASEEQVAREYLNLPTRVPVVASDPLAIPPADTTTSPADVIDLIPAEPHDVGSLLQQIAQQETSNYVTTPPITAARAPLPRWVRWSAAGFAAVLLAGVVWFITSKSTDSKTVAVTAEKTPSEEQRKLTAIEEPSTDSVTDRSQFVVGESIDLLKQIEVSRDVVAGNWRFEKEKLLTNYAALKETPRLQVPYPLPEEYVLDVTVERTGEQDPRFSLGFVTGGRQGMFAIDGFGSPGTANIATALEMIGGVRGNKSSTAYSRGKRLLPLGEPQSFSIEVRKTGVLVRHNQSTIIDWKGRAEEFSVHPAYQIPNRQALMLAAKASFTIHSLTLTPRSKASMPVTTTDYDYLATGKWVRLIDSTTVLTDPKQMKLKDGILELDRKYLEFPNIIARDVIVRAQVRKLSGLNLGIQLRSTQGVGYYGGWYNAGDDFGIGKSSKTRWGDLQGGRIDREFKPGDFVEMTVSVVGDSFALYIDGRQMYSFQDKELERGMVSFRATNGKSLFKDVEYQILDADTPTSPNVPPANTGTAKGPSSIPPAAAKPQAAKAPFSTETAQLHQQAWAEYLGVPVTFENSIGMKFSLIPPGEFLMGGGAESEDQIPGNGNLRHRVTLTKPYYLGIHETRQRDFQTVAGKNPSKFSPTNGGSLDHPVETVRVSDIVDFCRKLSSLAGEKNTGRVYRLPSEAEWEHACRAGTTTRFSHGETITRVQANLKGSGSAAPAPIGMTTRVGSYAANAWGLFDMHGNASEWTSDFSGNFNRNAVTDPRGPTNGGPKVFKGGDFGATESFLLSSGMRYYGGLGATFPHMGFRVVLEVATENGPGSIPSSASLDSPPSTKKSDDSIPEFQPAWDPANVRELATLTGHTGVVLSVAFSADGKRLASASYDQTVKVWDAMTGQETLTLNGHTKRVESVAFSSDGTRLASASFDGTVKVWDATSGRETLTLNADDISVESVAFSPDGTRLASSAYGDHAVKVWDATSGKNTFTLRHAEPVTSVAFSPDGTRLASASRDKTVRVWDATSGKWLRTLKGHSDYVVSVAFSPDGTRLASAGYDQTAKLWDAMSGREILTLKGHTGMVLCVTFSPDGKRLASAGGAGTIKVWDSTSGQETLTLKGVKSVAFSPDGTRLASASDKTVKIWGAGIETGAVSLPSSLGILDKRITVSFNRTPLQDAITEIGQKGDFEIEIDGDALKLIGLTRNMPQTFRVTDKPAREALEEITKKSFSLVVINNGNRFLLTTRTDAVKKNLTIVVPLTPTGK
ncbi:MAG: SUMF1/EgtB/PvdO family nonheme iron enzyme [Planctomycetales bacterium]|nr:SUMF1/EgtB/PvdO family nonheme iron enzyme [Planctomycetales bacterium]